MKKTKIRKLLRSFLSMQNNNRKERGWTKPNQLSEKIIGKVIGDINNYQLQPYNKYSLCEANSVPLCLKVDYYGNFFCSCTFWHCCVGLCYIVICIVPTSCAVQTGEGLNVAVLQLFVLDCAGVHGLCIEEGGEQQKTPVRFSYHIQHTYTHTHTDTHKT